MKKILSVIIPILFFILFNKIVSSPALAVIYGNGVHYNTENGTSTSCVSVSLCGSNLHDDLVNSGCSSITVTSDACTYNINLGKYQTKCSRSANCPAAPSCTPKKAWNCSTGAKCGNWSRNCSISQNCGTCDRYGSNYSCVHNSASGFKGGGNCVKDSTSCTQNTCNSLGADGTDGAPCDKQYKGCNAGDLTCQGCNAGLSCTGKNSHSYSGTCTPDSNTTYNVNVMAFLDTDGNGKDPSYNVCYPAPPASPLASASVTVTIGSDSPTSKTSWNNCKTKGSGVSKGMKLTTTQRCKSVKLTVPTGYHATGYTYSVAGNPSVTKLTGNHHTAPKLCGDNYNIKFGIKKDAAPPPPQASGIVFTDNVGDHIYDPDNDPCYNGNVTGLRVAGVTEPPFNGCDGFAYDLASGSQTIKLNPPPAGYQTTGLSYTDDTHATLTPVDAASITSEFVNVTGDSEVDFGIIPAPQTYYIKGTIFNDISGKKQYMDGTDTPYGGANKTISLKDNDPTSATYGQVIKTTSAVNGAYSFTGLDSADYEVDYASGPPAGNEMTWPDPTIDISPPYSFNVTVGEDTACNINQDSASLTQQSLRDAACVPSSNPSGGGITGLNFGFNAIGGVSWFQTVGGDLRKDDSLIDEAPDNNYVSAAKLTSPAIDPGIVFTAQSSANLGAPPGAQNAKANTNGWLALNNKFNPTRGIVRTSYANLSDVITKGGLTIYAMFSGDNNNNPPCVGAKPNCTFPAPVGGVPAASFPAHVYTADGLTIQGAGNYTFANNTNYIFLINGNLIIQRNLIVPVGSTVLFAVSGDIEVGANIITIEGIYSAGHDFKVDAGGGALNVNGSVIADANLAGGTLKNLRDLGVGLSGNGFFPSVKFNFRPDFVLNLPTTVRIPNYIIQEVGPGPNFDLTP